MPTLHTAAPHLLPYPSSGADLVAEGDDILRELAARLAVIIGPPSGSAGGDLGGTYPNPQVVTINGVAVSAVVFTGDVRLSDSRAPAGAAGGDLAGSTYPSPVVATINGRAKTAVVFTDDARLSDPRTAISAVAAAAVQVRDVGEPGQIRAGRVLTAADFTALGLAAPSGLWNLGSVAAVAGAPLVNKGAVLFGPGIMGAATEAAVFAGSTGQALYIVDTGGGDALRISAGSWGCWFRTAKRGTQQHLIAKSAAAAGQRAWELPINTGNVLQPGVYSDGTSGVAAAGVTDVCDDRWHFAVVTHDGAKLRLYVDGTLETTAAAPFAIFAGSSPLNIGANSADAATAAASPHFGRVDEAFVTPDVLSEDQVRNLYCVRLAHALAVTPAVVRLAVRRRKRGGPLAVADFPAQPVRLHNFTAGVFTDQGSGNVALAAVGGGTISDVAGADGTTQGAKNFAGAHTGLGATDTGLPSGMASRSYECWFKTSSLTVGTVVAWGTVTTADARLAVSAAGVLSAVSGGNSVIGPFVADGLWHHAVVVEDNAPADGVKRKMYLDGRLVATSLVLTSLTLSGANGFRIGATSSGTQPFTGQIDGAFVHSIALTPEQVRALYNVGSQPLAPSPKNAGDHVQALDATSLLATFDMLDGCDQIDLGVSA